MSDIYSDEFSSGRAPGVLAISPAFTRAAGAALFLLIAVGMGVWAYRLGTRDAGEVPIIRAMEGPARVQPADPGGDVPPHQGLEVNSVLSGEPAPDPAAAPNARIVTPAVGLQPEDGPQGELVLAVPKIPAFPMPEGGDLRVSGSDDAAAALADRSAGGSAFAEGADAVAALIEAALRAEAGPEAEADEAPVDAGPRPLGRPSGLAARRAAPQPAEASPSRAPDQQGTASASAAPGPVVAAREVANVAPGSRLVQLGAFDSEGLARQVWGQLAGRHGDLLGAKSLFLERATHNARVFYRLRVSGFGSPDETQAMCEQLRVRGVDCIPVTLN